PGSGRSSQGPFQGLKPDAARLPRGRDLLLLPGELVLERQAEEDGWTVTLQSPGTAFLVVRLDRSLLLTPEQVAAAALATLRADYPDLEAEPAMEMLAGELAVGHDVNFFSLDLSNTCWTRSFYGAAGTVLVMCQVSDLEQEQYEPVLRAVCASLQAEE